MTTVSREPKEHTSQASPSDFGLLPWRPHHLSCSWPCGMCVCEGQPHDGNHLTAPTLCRTIAHLRSPQSSHLLKSVNVANHHECRASEEVCNMPRSRVLLVVRAVMWCGVVAYDAAPSRGDSRWKATCLPCTSVPLPHYDAHHSDCTKHRSLRADSHPSSVQQKNNLQHHGRRSHDIVDPDTRLKCDFGCASSEHLILCVEVTTQTEGRRSSEKYTQFYDAKFLQ